MSALHPPREWSASEALAATNRELPAWINTAVKALFETAANRVHRRPFHEGHQRGVREGWQISRAKCSGRVRLIDG